MIAAALPDRLRGRLRWVVAALVATAAISSVGLPLSAWALGSEHVALMAIMSTVTATASIYPAWIAYRHGFDWLASRVQSAPDSELEQAAVRVGLMLLILVALIGTAAWEGFTQLRLRDALWCGPAPFAVAWLLLGDILDRPGPNPVRRLFGNTVDVVTISAFVGLGSPETALWTFAYLWVGFGAGFRYGVRYLLHISVCSAIGFAAVAIWNPFWASVPSISLGVLAALVMLPAYSAVLLRRLNEAKHQAEAARAQAEEANATKSRFLAAMSHELRTPLTTIDAGAKYLLEREHGGESRDVVRAIDGASANLLQLINDLLDAARLEVGRFTLKPVALDLPELLKQVATQFRPRAREKNVELLLRVDAALPITIVGDPLRLRQILTNLVSNAVKFTGQGEVILTARAVGESIQFEVSDTGIGIAQEDQRRIFEPFTQAEDSIERRFGGTGLGLAIATQLTTLMDGQIQVESLLGAGSTFRLQIPLVVAVEQATATAVGSLEVIVESSSDLELLAMSRLVAGQFGWSAHARSGERRASIVVARGSTTNGDVVVQVGTAALGADGTVATIFTRPTIDGLIAAFARATHFIEPARAVPDRAPAAVSKLVYRALLADDNATNRMLIGNMLREIGCNVTEAACGEAALDRLEADRFDIAFLDMRMPDHTGIEVAKLHRMLSVASGQEPTPMVLLSADDAASIRPALADAGISIFLPKPVDVPALRRALEQVLVIRDLEFDDEPREEPVRASQVTSIETHPGFRGSREPVVDRMRVQSLTDTDHRNEIDALAVAFAADAESTVADMRQAARDLDRFAFLDHVHALRSAALQVGAQRLVGALRHELPASGGPALRAYIEAFANRAEEETQVFLTALASFDSDISSKPA